MRWLNHPAVWVLVLYLSASPASGEIIEYYVWTDDDGMIHAAGTPPAGRDYETRTIVVDPGASAPAGAATDRRRPAADSGSARRADSPPEMMTDYSHPGVDAAIAEEEQRRLEEGPAPDAGGAKTATGADTAVSGTTAPVSGTAAGGATAAGAATAPGAAITPVFIGP